MARSRTDVAVWAVAAVMLAAATWRIWSSLGQILDVDELYTTTLIGDGNLFHMWETAFRGVDGNPPLYMTLAWGLVRAVPIGTRPVLLLFNLGIMIGAAATLHAILRRIADPVSAAVGLAAICYLSIGPGFALQELRTYALYLLLVGATLWATLAVLNQPTGARVAALAALGTLAALAHSYGGFYVAADLGAAAAAAVAGGRVVRLWALAAAAVVPFAVTAAWVVLATPHQLATATPYGWILKPELPLLLLALTGSVTVSIVALALLPVLLLVLARRRHLVRRWVAVEPERSAFYAILAAFAAITLAAWVASQVVTPFFTYRYFVPNTITGATLVTLALARLREVVRPALQIAAAIAVVAVGASTVVAGGIDKRQITPCLGGNGRFLDDGIAGADLPVVAESPQDWMPHTAYEPDRKALYPLDWEVVLRYRDKARNNAMDYHIMETLSDRAPAGSALATDVLPTEAILARYDTFLVLNEASRSWFDHLRATVPLQADLLKETAACKLWQVRLIHAPADRG